MELYKLSGKANVKDIIFGIFHCLVLIKMPYLYPKLLQVMNTQQKIKFSVASEFKYK